MTHLVRRLSVEGNSCSGVRIMKECGTFYVVFEAESVAYGATEPETLVSNVRHATVEDAVEYAGEKVRQWGCYLDEPEAEPNEDMDGDAESALASAGLGTDEDYGCACDPYDCEYDCGGEGF